MSSVAVEPTAATGQMYFAFSQQSGAEHTVSEMEPESFRCSASQQPWDDSVPATGGRDAVVARVHSPGELRSKRIAEPVKLGAVMFQLLRQYGISEEEIRAGLQAYAKRRETQSQADTRGAQPACV